MVILDSAMTIMLEPIVTDLMGNSGFKYSLVGSMVYFGNIILLYPLVKLSDKIGRKKTIIISLVIAVIGTFLLSFSTEYWMILVLRFVLGLNSIAGVLSALVIDHFPEEERGKPLSLFSIGLVAGFLIGTVIGGPLLEYFGQRDSFLILSGFAALGVVNGIINIRDVSGNSKFYSEDQALKIPVKKTWEFMKRNNAIIGTLILNFLMMIIMSGSGTYAVYVLLNHFELDLSVGGLYLLPIQIFQIILFAFLGRTKDFDLIYKIQIILIIILIGFGISFLFIDNAIVFAICITFFGAPMVIVLQSADSISHKLTPQEHKSNLVSIYRIVGIVGQIIGPALFGLFIDYLWIYSPGYFIILLLIFMEILYWIWISRLQKPEPEVN
jgi:MFS family permease